ncbi:YhgE/Pip domain-containing protein [Adlercreutzia faecimuris]|uniref:YhgE/Pip domain-containing protein n=1 Tax=Adlercreutzia faecimuris TaxID=2897341 RepID=A0ABS9WGH9_9ACTN|nr:YhgE/Pip domain-containing protein [Adlercreutzia sp. JBNU-10]MCI2241899.1 YhgE/Pip domain-containing protein [Adlercreutzia sp. JBNU-10]
MGNALRVLRRDVLRLLKVPPALVVVVALLVLPSIYTWYNVIGFWNPYDNTGNLRVCVVNQDEGGSSELTGELHVGDMIVDKLHENDQLKWEFTDYDDAMAQLDAGEAYAAFVIPPDFTADLLTLTTGDFTQPALTYYVNEKAGPVAPKITDAGATTLDETINSTFVSTVSDVVAGSVDEAYLESQNALGRTREGAAGKLAEASEAVAGARDALAQVGDAVAQARDRAEAARGDLARAREGVEAASRSLSSTSDLAARTQEGLGAFAQSAMPAVGQALTALSQGAARADAAVSGLNQAVAGAQGSIGETIGQGSAAVGRAEALASELHAAAAALPEGDPERAALEAAASELDQRNAEARQALGALADLNGQAGSVSSSAAEASAALSAAVSQATDAAGGYSDALFGTTLPAVEQALGSLARASASLSAAVAGQRTLIDQASAALGQLTGTLDAAADAVGQTDGLLAGLEGELSLVRTDVMAIGQSGALTRLFGDEGLDAAKIADFMGSPTELVTEQLYPLNAYGSAMAPLFMNLTFWIGAFMLLVIMKQEVDGEGIPGLTIAQRYLGRFLLLAAMAVLQAVICCAGVLAIGVQAASAPALFFAAAVTSLSYLSIIYALSVTLQHIGKGICVVLVFAQIPGATGLYPIEMTSGFFQAIYPFFPFTYGIGAMREAIFGFYGTAYAGDLAMLALFFAVSMALGLIVRPLMANVNLMVADQVRAGGLFNGERVEVPRRPYRFSQIVRVLSDRDEYRASLEERYARFRRWYPRLIRGAVVVGVAVPAALAVVFALTPAEKVWVLTGWLAFIAALFVFLVVVESLRCSFERQLRLGSLPDERLLELYGARQAVEDGGDEGRG